MRDGGLTTPEPPTAPRSERFRPAPWLSNRHLQTVAPLLWPRGPEGGEVHSRVVDVAEGAAVGVRVAQAAGRPRGTVLLVPFSSYTLVALALRLADHLKGVMQT